MGRNPDAEHTLGLHLAPPQAETRLLAAAGVASFDELLALPVAGLVAAVWRSVPPVPLESSYPKSVVYTSGTSGFKATGLVHDTGGYSAGVAETMTTVFDAVPGADVIFVDARPSWVTGQTYGITGALTTRTTSVLCAGMLQESMPQCMASLVKQLGVTIFVAGASFLKRCVRNARQASWLQKQALHECLRIAASCGEPLSPEVQKLGMATLCPNYINSYWASEHGAIVLGHMYGNADQPLQGDTRMYVPTQTRCCVLGVVCSGTCLSCPSSRCRSRSRSSGGSAQARARCSLRAPPSFCRKAQRRHSLQVAYASTHRRGPGPQVSHAVGHSCRLAPDPR